MLKHHPQNVYLTAGTIEPFRWSGRFRWNSV